ncbi:LPS translocon maturation chaperone LptM [Vreelandella sp. V005]|jgi:predicted small lipoprotein YifL|nr:lipoprotein [uncultured Halomonas sp.]|tara:strand:+ start:243 stop:374 length:132 start_codon:yes stop_codon:yes gene_type:complete
MKALAIVTLSALLLTGLAGCGQKGPLYLPDDAPADEQASQATE